MSGLVPPLPVVRSAPTRGLDTALLTNEVDKLSVELLTDDHALFRFDGSDLDAERQVGAGTFWTAMVDWTTTDVTSQEVTDQVERSWPA